MAALRLTFSLTFTFTRTENNAMKMTPEHYAILRDAIAPVIAKYPDAASKYKADGLSPMRYRWDLLHSSGVHVCHQHNVWANEGKTCIPACDYLNDDHIDTALRAVVRELQPGGALTV